MAKTQEKFATVVLSEEAAKASQKTRENMDCDRFCKITREFDGRRVSCLVAASIFCPWTPNFPSERRPVHNSKFKNGWKAGYNTRTAYVDAFVILRSMLGLFTSTADVITWHEFLEVDADFQIEQHMKSLRGENTNNTKYHDNGWLEEKSGKVRATVKGIKIYKDRYFINHNQTIEIVDIE